MVVNRLASSVCLDSDHGDVAQHPLAARAKKAKKDQDVNKSGHSASQWQAALRAVKKGEQSQSQVAVEFGVGRSAVSTRFKMLPKLEKRACSVTRHKCAAHA